MNRRVGVIAVIIIRDVAGRLARRFRAVVGVAIPVAIGVPVPRATRFIAAHAIVIQAVAAHFHRAGMHACSCVVAVVIVIDVAGRLARRFRAVVGVAIPVAIGVPVPHARFIAAFVDLAIAVVVHPIAGLRGPRVGGVVAIITVRVISHVACGLVALVYAVVRIAEPVGVGIAIPCRDVLVDLLVAIIILSVAQLRRARVDGVVAVIAIVIVINVPGWLIAIV
jgi:hypothetical protein